MNIFRSWPRRSFVSLVILVCAASATVAASPNGNRDKDVDRLLGSMTPAEKTSLIRGAEEPADTNTGAVGYLSGVPRLGIPPIRLADGPPGVRTRLPSLAETATMGLAATFSRDDAKRNGEVIGREAERLGIDVVLEPFINIDRDIAFSRGYNTFGEDPVLTGEIGAAEIRGIQSRGIMAQAKHYIGYDTNAQDVSIDQQTLHEVYLAPFADAVQAGVSSIMCSLNKINGAYGCANPDTLKKLLRDELHFEGFVTSDWGGVHSNVSINAGVDMEMPGVLSADSSVAGIMPSYFDDTPPPRHRPLPDYDWVSAFIERFMPEEPDVPPIDVKAAFAVAPDPQNLWEARRAGLVSVETVDRAVGHVLHEVKRFGLLNRKGPRPIGQEIDAAGDAAIVQKTSEDAAVLLKNEDAILPLNMNALGSVALIGPGAGQVVAVGKTDERSLGFTERQVSPLAALRALAPLATITYAVDDDMTGSPVPATVLSHDGKPGLVRSQENGVSAIDAQIDFTDTNHAALPPNPHLRWTGTLTVPTTGVYWLNIQALGARGTLYVDGKRVGGSPPTTKAPHGDTVHPNQDSMLPTTDGLDNRRMAVELTAGHHPIEVALSGNTLDTPAQVRLNWATPASRQADHEAAVAAAKAAKTAIVFLWSRGDPAFQLPGDQDKLVMDIAAVNQNTIVVLNTSQPVAMPWIGHVKAVLEMWWSGDTGGLATADILTGRANPAGRLPFTWARRLEDYAATDPAHPERSSKGVNGKTVFSEGVDIGYRWFDRQQTAPLYPFGYGLSYGKFDYSGLKVTSAADGGLTVRFRVTNTSPVDGDEVPQVYLGAPASKPPGVQFPIQSLVGFDRIFVKAGQTKLVELQVPLRRLQYWSVANSGWITSTRTRTVYVGASSRDLRLHAALD